ncbi:hypothetical protein OG455_13275 [Kitasatospora sp. NBC_01287]|uniref:hypothetical protein n=1 Tax=Kitasatospora sp. NBC_01287 TaxID=2903573 RepID=UPI002253CC80|nr:hypothetical protein [Kitasatospora sp. NBC_01287]MCX4746484.1 hypothetical protein [Kitasatospora sp. NBC_01287]
MPPRPAAPRPQIPKPGPRPAPVGPAVQLLPAAPGSALERADEAVDQLLESGRSPGDILVLTSGQSHPWQQHELSFGADRYWAQLAEASDVFYADLALNRPAKREVVILVLDREGRAAGRESERAAAVAKARTHAASLLVVCGATDQLTGTAFAGGQPALA